MARIRITGTVEEALKVEEARLNRALPVSFKSWLLEHNGSDMEGIHIYPVRDERDTRKTWESLAYNLNHEWAEGLCNFAATGADYSQLLPFADYGTADYFCFDYSVAEKNGETPVVIWSRKTGEIGFYAKDFTEFKEKILKRDSE